MKQYLLTLLILFACANHLVAQDFIMLDGKQILKKELNQFNGEGYKIDLKKQKYASSLKSIALKRNVRVAEQRIFTSAGLGSFAQVTVFEHTDSAYYYPNSSYLKFFDKKGNLKWEKRLDKKVPAYCYLSPDGKYSIVDIHGISNEDYREPNSLFIFDEKGDTILEYPFPVKFCASKSRDFVCYRRDKNEDDKKSFYCLDLKTGKQWSKTFGVEVSAEPVSFNGDYLRVWAGHVNTIYSRAGEVILKKHDDELGGSLSSISNDGKYLLGFHSSSKDTTNFTITNIVTMEQVRTNYFDVGKAKYKIYNGGNFVNNSAYIVAMTSIVAPYTAMIIFHNIKGEYLGHKLYYNIRSSFWSPNITLLADGSFVVYMDNEFYGNMVLPNVDTKQYFSE